MADRSVTKASLEFFQTLIDSNESFADDKVCVIGIIGKGSFGHKCKARHINSAIEKELFKLGFVDKFPKSSSNPISPCDIEVYHDVEQRIIYLHLDSLFDASRLALLCQQAASGCSNSESHRYWKNQEYYHACAMLFMFSVSHIMLMIHPSTTFDLGYIRLFRTLASTRYQLLSQISQCLSGVDGLPEIWRQTGRPCIPRLICSFKQIVPISALDPSTATALHKDTYASRAKVKTQVNNSQRNLQNALQEQIYHLMRKARLLGSLSSSSLFTVSSGHSFVHVEPSASTFDPVSIMLNKLAMPAIKSQWAESSVLLKDNGVFKPRPSPKDITNDSLSEEILFKDYLKQQIENLMTGDAGRDGVAEGRRGTHVEVPRCRQWAQVCLSLYKFYMGKGNDSLPPFVTMASQLDLDMKFSVGRCCKVLPLASSTYLENLPSHYTRNVHLSQLSQALHVFSQHARGPAYEHYAAQLQEECNKIWTNGRQLCEERSLTGRHCVYPYHKVPEDLGEYLSEKSKEDGTIPCKPHSSRITSLCACNCGRTQEHRDDPFDIRTANYDFFKVLEDKCCAYLLHLIFPCHPSFSLSKAPELSLKDAETHEDEPLLEMATENKSPPVHEENSGGDVNEEVPAVSSQHVSGIIPIPKSALMSRDSKESTGSHVHTTGSHGHTTGSHGQSSSSLFSLGAFHSILDTMSHDGTGNEYKSVTSGLGGEISTVGSEEPLSTVELHTHVGDVIPSPKKLGNEQAFLQTMLTDQSLEGVLPLFPSWSLCRLGSLSSYQPAKGLEQPGFFPGSNFLLAWDIPLSNENHTDLTSQFDSQGKLFSTKATSSEAWPAPNELPTLAGSTPSLPLHQALTYSQRQCADMKVNATQIVISQNVGKGATSGGSTRSRGRNTRDTGPPTVRAYIGNEYECPRGHRFICSGPDKMVKATTSGHVKESAHKLVTMDMPLYFPCPCRSSKPLLAQLSRIYVATPDSPVLVSLYPRVQPAAPPCPIFHPGIGTGISLPPASLCVLRFPYVYVGPEGPILPPGDSQPLLSCRLLKNVYLVSGRG